MKVIIQDVETKAYLSEDGRWVANKAEARDFQTLLRAYHFAKDNTSRNFEVLLHCPDDDYSAGIINGIGTANAEAAVEVAPVKMVAMRSSRKVSTHSTKSRFDLSIFHTTRNYLN